MGEVDMRMVRVARAASAAPLRTLLGLVVVVAFLSGLVSAPAGTSTAPGLVAAYGFLTVVQWALPLDPFTRHRLYLLVNRPYQTLSVRRLRRTRAPAAVAAG